MDPQDWSKLEVMWYQRSDALFQQVIKNADDHLVGIIHVVHGVIVISCHVQFEVLYHPAW